jgi:hypothetical protein
VAFRAQGRPEFADDGHPVGTAAVQPAVRAYEPHALGHRASVRHTEHAHPRPAGAPRTDDARAGGGARRGGRRLDRPATEEATPGRRSSGRTCRSAGRFRARRGGADQRGRLQRVRHAQPGGVMARIRPLPLSVPARRRQTSGCRRRGAGPRSVCDRGRQDAHARLPAARLPGRGGRHRSAAGAGRRRRRRREPQPGRRDHRTRGRVHPVPSGVQPAPRHGPVRPVSDRRTGAARVVCGPCGDRGRRWRPRLPRAGGRLAFLARGDSSALAELPTRRNAHLARRKAARARRRRAASPSGGSAIPQTASGA